MNVSEYMVSFLEDKGIDKVFGVVGGAALWICKALSESRKIEAVFTNHEQAAAMAADGWARITGKPGVVFTINGPGMTNTVTGIAQAWTDSSPIILITGNSNLNSVKYEREKGMRQYGTQDVRTDSIMQSITKKVYLLERPEDVKQCLKEAYELALSGRPGPVCIEIPINIQSAEVPETEEAGISDSNRNFAEAADEKWKDQLNGIINRLISAKRPLVLAGQGIRLAGAVEAFRGFIEKYKLPVVNSRMGIDTILSASDLFVGRAGNHGSRASHFALQTCDVLLIMGSRMAPNTTGYDVEKFSSQSYKILIEIDENELNKFRLNIDETVHVDIGQFLEMANGKEERELFIDAESRSHWISCCNDWKKRYPIMQEKYYSSQRISTYRVVEIVSDLAKEDDLILSDTGSCCSIVAQVWQVKEKQRVFISGGLSAMGYWATAMGVAIGNSGTGQVICFVGDGSLQMNIHELATIKSYGLLLKIFVINNGGYQFVKMSQAAYGIVPPFGTDTTAGVPIPDIQRVVEAYGIHYRQCVSAAKLYETIIQTMNSDQAEVCEIFVDENQEVCPRLKSVAAEDGRFISPDYENLYPFLPDELLKREMKKAY